MRGISFGFALAIAVLAPPATAQERASKGDICLNIAHRWTASGTETGTIATVLVPDSFRRLIATTGCARWQFAEASLIDWHLNFGDERSTVAALRFLATVMAAEHPRPADLAGAIAKAHNDAAVDIARVRAIAAKRPIDRDALQTAKQRHTIAALEGLVGTFEAQVRLASWYQQAAEHYRSAALFVEGAARATSVERALVVLRSKKLADDEVPAVQIATGIDRTVDDTILRRTISRASLTDTVANLIAARAAVRAQATPLLDRVGQLNDGTRTCGSDPDPDPDPDLTALLAACGDVDNFERLARDHWVARGLLDIAELRAALCESKPPATTAVDRAIARLAAEIEPGDDGFGWPNYLAERMVDLFTARAEALTHDGCAVPEWLYAAAGDLARAQRLIRPSDAPARFRIVAERTLALEGRMRQADANWDERNAAYLRVVLAQLDTIATAGPDPEPMR